MNAHMTREEQFTVALMVLGELPNIRFNLIAHSPDRLSESQKPVTYPQFVAYKAEVVALLETSDMFDVYYEHVVHGSRGVLLTEKASSWIGEYFRWMAAGQQKVTQRV